MLQARDVATRRCGSRAHRPFRQQIYGSVANGTDTAFSDTDLLIVADDLTLEELYSVLIPVEEDLGRRIHPTLYASRAFAGRKFADSGFVTRVLGREHLVLMEREDAAAAAR